MRQCLKESKCINVAIVFTQVISKLSRQQNFAIIKNNLGSTTAFSECHRKFSELYMNIKNTIYDDLKTTLF